MENNTITLAKLIDKLNKFKDLYGENTPVFIHELPNHNSNKPLSESNYYISALFIGDKNNPENSYILLDGYNKP